MIFCPLSSFTNFGTREDGLLSLKEMPRVCSLESGRQ